MNKYSRIIAALSLGAMLTVPGTVQAQDKYLGEIFQVGFSFCPVGSLEAAGQTLAINTNTALFSLYGTTYGGNGQVNFMLPDLRGRTPMGQGQGPGLSPRQMGEETGVESTTLTIAQMPAHNHLPRISVARANADSLNPINNSFARGASDTYLDTAAPDPASLMNPGTVVSNTVGNNQPISTMSPVLVTRFCVATQGIFPSRP